MTTPLAVLDQARARLGWREQPDGSNRVAGVTDWYGMVGPWCAMFVSRCFWDAGLPLPATTAQGFAWTPSGVAWFKNQGRWHDGPAGIQPGDVVFFDFQTGDRYPVDHVGIVEQVHPNGTFTTIEGNTANQVARHRRTTCKGYGRPPWHHPPTPPIEEDDMTPEQAKLLEETAARATQAVQTLHDHVLPQLADQKVWLLNVMAAIVGERATTLTDVDLDAIAAAVAEEQARRLGAGQ
jgi:hypothetical protein